MKLGLRQAVFIALILGLMAPSAMAQDLCLPTEPCKTSGTPGPVKNDAGGPKDPMLVPTITAPKADFLGRVGDFARDAKAAVGPGMGKISDGISKLVAGLGGLVLGLLASLAAALAAMRPSGMGQTAWAAAAGGSVGAAAFAAQAASWLTWKKLFPLGLGLFSRIDKDELLENDRRSRIFELIKTNPGIHLSEIARELDFAWGTTLHHLRKLRADRLVMFKSLGHHKSFFVNGSGLSEKQMEAMSLIKNGTLANLANFLEAHPRVSLKELSEALGISPPLAAFHVRKLEKAGFVQKVREGKNVRLSTTEAVPAGFFKNIAEAAPAPLPVPAEAAA